MKAFAVLMGTGFATSEPEEVLGLSLWAFGQLTLHPQDKSIQGCECGEIRCLSFISG